jgi:colanic acid/amylovoran biosynthesis glycosyltransferase
MRVLHLFDRYLPHTMNWAFRLLHAMPRTEIAVAAPWMVRNEYFTPDFQYFIPPWQGGAGRLPTDEWQQRRLADLLIRTEKYLPVYRFWLEKQLRGQPPDLLHAHFAPIGYHYLPLARRLKRPLVVSFYGYDYESLPWRRPVWRQRYRTLFDQAAWITCAGPHGRDLLLSYGAPAEKLRVSPMSVDTRDFSFYPAEKPAHTLRLVQVATFTEKKGQLDTLEAFRLALPRAPGLTLTFAGEAYDQALYAEIAARIRKYQLEQQATLHPVVSQAQMPAFLRQFDVCIHPSKYSAQRDCEGGPVTILEAQAVGLPVISTSHFDIPSEVLHGRTGLLAPEGDVEALAAHILTFYQMEAPAFQQYRLQARAHMEAHFEVRKTAEKLCFE